MSKLQICKVSENAIIPVVAGSSTFPIAATDIRFEAVIRNGASHAKAYWLKTGLAFNVPESHILKVYSAPDIARANHARLAECVALVEPGDHSELTLRMVIDDGGKSFEPKAGMVVAKAILEKIVCPELVEVDSFDAPTPTAEKEPVKAKRDVVAKAVK